MAIRVLLADDEPLMRSGLVLLLGVEPDIEVVGEAADGRTAIEQAYALRPDVVLMDVRMPGMDGVEATRRIAADGVRVLILTTYHVDDTVYAALRAGAAGFLLKDAVPAELAAAIRAVAAGEGWLDPAVAQRLIEDIAARPDTPLPGPGALDRLTAREREVLTLMAYGLSNAEIAAHLVLGEATVKTHVGRVLSKLGARDRTGAVAYAYQSGLVRPGAPPPGRQGR